MGNNVQLGSANTPRYTFKNDMSLSFERRVIEATNNGVSIKAFDRIGHYQYSSSEAVLATDEAQLILGIVAKSGKNDGAQEISVDDLAQLYSNFKNKKCPSSILNMSYDEQTKTYDIKYHTGSNPNLDITDGDYYMTFKLQDETPKAKQQEAKQQTEHSCPSFWDDPLEYLKHRWLSH